MNDERIRRILRVQAWRRAKAELDSALDTYYDGGDEFKRASELIENFIETVEEEGLLGT